MIKIPKDTEERLLGSVRRYFDEHMEEEIGDLKASMLLTFCIEEIGPTIYNLGVADAQAQMHTHVEDLTGACYEAEFGYWKR